MNGIDKFVIFCISLLLGIIQHQRFFFNFYDFKILTLTFIFHNCGWGVCSHQCEFRCLSYSQCNLEKVSILVSLLTVARMRY